MNTKKQPFNLKRYICLALVVLMVVAVIIAVIPSANQNTGSATTGVEPALPVNGMGQVSGIREELVYPDGSTTIPGFTTNRDTPAYLNPGVPANDSITESAGQLQFTSDITLSSNKVNVTYSSLDYALKRLVFNDSGIQVVNGGTGKGIHGDLSALQTLLNKSGMQVGFMAVRISDGAVLAYQPEKNFQSCSTIKAAYSLYVAKLIDEGKLAADKAIAYTPSAYTSGSGVIKNYPFGTHFKVQTLLKYAITESDNVAHVMLNNSLGSNGFFDMLNRIGCNIPQTSNDVWPESNAYSSVLWWSQIYSFKNNSQTGAWLWNQFGGAYSKINTALGESKACYTKTGSSTYCSHEAGVILGNEPYIISVFTKTNSPYGVSDYYFNSLIREIDKLIAG